MKPTSRLFGLTALGFAVLAMAGCKMIEQHKAVETERMLAAAGFQMKIADTPEKMAHLATLTQRKIVPHDKDGEAFFVYADAVDCKCVYVGNQTNYQEYQKLVQQQNIADQEEMTAAMNENAAMNWNIWGGFRPWY